MLTRSPQSSEEQQVLVPKAAITIPRDRSRRPSAFVPGSYATTGRASVSRSAHMMSMKPKSFESHAFVDVESPNFKTQHPEDEDEIMNSLRKTYLADHYKRDSRSILEPQDMAKADSFGGDKNNSAKSDVSERTLTPNLSRAGGDITRDIFKYANNENNPKSSKSLEDVTLADETRRRRSTASGLNVPGGFRREFIVKKVREQNQNHQKSTTNDYGTSVPSSAITSADNSPSPNNSTDLEQVPFLTRNFMEFLYVYGHFAGESFEDDFLTDEEGYGLNGIETSGLLTHEARALKSMESVKGTTPTSKAFLLLLKSFIGTGVLFLPHAFANGGLLFSITMLTFFGLYSYWCYYILIVSKRITGVSSFGDIGYRLYGQWMKFIILFSLVLTQFGFSGAYVIFTAENLKAFATNVFLIPEISIVYFILLQLVVFIPLSFIRNVSKLSLPSLLANFFIMAGLIIVFFFSTSHLSEIGFKPAEGTIIGFNSNRWTMFVGTAIFAFEGIGLIIPVQDSMKHPEKFPLVLGLVITTATVLFILIASVGYMAYGSSIETVILLNLPQKNIFVNLIQFFYSLAIMLSTPLQLFPAIKIVESKVFPKFTKIYVRKSDNTTNVEMRLNSGKLNWKIKWLKNFVRAIMVSLVCCVAYFGASQLDKFVSIIGSFACIPLVYMYPPMLHLQSYSRPKGATKKICWSSILDYVLIVFGGVAMLYTSYQSLFAS